LIPGCRPFGLDREMIGYRVRIRNRCISAAIPETDHIKPTDLMLRRRVALSRSMEAGAIGLAAVLRDARMHKSALADLCTMVWLISGKPEISGLLRTR
jgi:hypothetical protein